MYKKINVIMCIALLCCSVSFISAQTNNKDEQVDRVIAQVNSDIITLSELRDAIYRDAVTTKKRGYDLADAKVKLNDMIDNLLLLQAAKASKIDVSDEQVNKSVNETIDEVKKQYKTEAEFEQAVEKSGINLVKLKKTLYDKYKDNYTIHALVAGKFAITDKDVDNYAKELRAQNLPVNSYHLAQILVVTLPKASQQDIAKAKAKALDILIRIKKGEKFEQAAAEYSDDIYTKSNGGDMGTLDDSRLKEPILSAIDKLDVGGVSEPIQTDVGFHIFKVIDKSSIREKLYKKRFLEQRTRLITDLRQKASITIYDKAMK